MARFEVKGKDLYVEGRKVIKAWESFNGWYWFAVELTGKQDSVLDDRFVKDDRIYYGLVQGIEDEWGCFSEAELKSLKGKVWEIPKRNLPWSGRRNRGDSV